MAKMKFRLLAGRHYDGEREYIPAQYHKNPGDTDIVESTVDLVQRFGAEKFQRLYEEQLLQEQLRQEQSDGLDAMSVEDLRKYAASEKIDLGRAKTKPELIEAIRAAFAPA